MTIAEFDHFDTEKKKALLMQCCGSQNWVKKMLALPPVEDLVDLVEDAEETWYQCNEADWKEAFTHHPRIGDLTELKNRFSANEQASVGNASEQTLQSLADGNKMYAEKFGYTFIVCATGKSAVEMLGMLTVRLQNTTEEEINIAMDEQNKITKLRLEKLFEA